MSSGIKEKLWQLSGLVLGSIASWPSVLQLFEVNPAFAADVRLGSAAGFIFGSLLFFTKVIQWFAARGNTTWTLIVGLCFAALWFSLNRELAQMYNIAVEAPNITSDRRQTAQLAVWGMAVLWATPLSYIGALLGDRIARG
ncbi:hypothetical protein [Achromobacter sp.]|uniref:hypothetical protein n=1 Tax=Achromobacter sp. TaxID=134375 RepID=UPI0028A83EEB|nr:hypothetical protein [Achromobacter sp.]